MLVDAAADEAPEAEARPELAALGEATALESYPAPDAELVAAAEPADVAVAPDPELAATDPAIADAAAADADCEFTQPASASGTRERRLNRYIMAEESTQGEWEEKDEDTWDTITYL